MPQLRLGSFLPYRLSITSNRVSDAIASTYQALFGLKIPEWRLVAVIAEGKGVTQQALGRATRMDKMTVSRAATALFERGLIERTPNPGDQRSHLLTLSASGRALYEQIAPKALEMEARLFGELEDAERVALGALLEKLDEAAEALERG